MKDMTFEQIANEIIKLANKVGATARQARERHLKEAAKLQKKAA
ncbi:hypothetical protein ACTL6P_21520 [Endozoicomonas acroporae]|nr:hypothetical protein [Endozoicomonas acroporae]